MVIFTVDRKCLKTTKGENTKLLLFALFITLREKKEGRRQGGRDVIKGSSGGSN